MALAAVGGLLAGVVGLTSTATTSPTSLSESLTGTQSSSAAAWNRGGHSNGSNGYGSNGYGTAPSWSGQAQSQTATVDSSPATTAEGKGVALIDTVLSDGAAAGTGIVLTSDGEVLTNYHVVEGSTSIQVTIANTGDSYTATVVGADQKADIALLQLKDASGLTVSTIDDDTVKVGDDVTAVGNAGGTGSLSAADGTVTDLSTSLTTESEGTVAGETLKGVIETDADVVAGDSGGPLVDSDGEVIGIDTAASTGQEIDGYAIPIDTALTIVGQIRSGDETSAVRIGPAAFLGVELGATSTESTGYAGRSTDPYSTESTSGATIAGVLDGGAADDAGLTAGDTITKLGSTTISDSTDLSATLATLEPGDRTKVTWTDTDGRTESATVTLGSSTIN